MLFMSLILTYITHLSPSFKILPLPALPATRKVILLDRPFLEGRRQNRNTTKPIRLGGVWRLSLPMMLLQVRMPCWTMWTLP